MHIRSTPDCTSTPTREQNSMQIAALREDTESSHIAEHIRGLVAATMGNVSLDATDTTRHQAEQWQQWALSVAGNLAPSGANHEAASRD